MLKRKHKVVRSICISLTLMGMIITTPLIGTKLYAEVNNEVPNAFTISHPAYTFNDVEKTIHNIYEGAQIDRFLSDFGERDLVVKVFNGEVEVTEGTIEVGMRIEITQNTMVNNYTVKELLQPEGLNYRSDPASSFITPMVKTWGYRMTADFWWSGRKPSYCDGEYCHDGIDFAAPLGTPVRATQSGVARRHLDGPGGNMVIIEHGNGLVTWYAHLSSYTIPSGRVNVAQGDIIAYTGNSGDKSTGPHLHYAVRRNNTAIDPLPFLQNDVGGTVTPQPTGQNYGVLDAVTANLNVLSVSGWHITTKLQPATPADRVSNSRYLFVMDADTGGELGRYSIHQSWRQDVANAYAGTVRNGGYGGFNLSVPMQNHYYGRRIYFMTRYTNDFSGDQVIDEYAFRSNVYTVPLPQAYKGGNLEALNVSSTTISGGGWDLTGKLQPIQPTDRVSNSRYVFIMDADTGGELGRFSIDQNWRQDVANAYANIVHNGGYGGFSFSVPIRPEWRGKRVYIMTRYAADFPGDSIIEDFHFTQNVVTIPSY